MTKANWLIVLVLLTSLVIADQIQTTTSSTCCSTGCYTNYNNKIHPIKLRNQIFSSMYYNESTEAKIIVLLNYLPYDYFRQMKNSIYNFKKMIEIGVAFCPIEVTDPEEVASSQYDFDTYNLMFDIVADDLKQNMLDEGLSINAVNTYSDVVSRLRNMINEFYDGVPLVPQDKQNLVQQKKAARYAAFGLSSLIQVFSASNLNQTVDSLNNPQKFCDKYNNNPRCSHLYSSDTHIAKFSKPLNLFQLPSTDASLSNTSFFNKMMAKQQQQQVYLYPFALDKYRFDEPSIYTAQFMSFFNGIDFTANIYVPSDTDLSLQPNNGFNVGETADTVWARIMANLFGPYLYCRYPNMLNTMLNGLSCYATCNKLC